MRVTDVFIGRLRRAEKTAAEYAGEVGMSAFRLSRLLNDAVAMSVDDHWKVLAIGKALGLRPGQCVR